jgi:hypothetical protein
MLSKHDSIQRDQLEMITLDQLFYFGEIKASTLVKNGANTRELDCYGRF